jgi:hypothetical protein
VSASKNSIGVAKSHGTTIHLGATPPNFFLPFGGQCRRIGSVKALDQLLGHKRP